MCLLNSNRLESKRNHITVKLKTQLLTSSSLSPTDGDLFIRFLYNTEQTRKNHHNKKLLQTNLDCKGHAPVEITKLNKYICHEPFFKSRWQQNFHRRMDNFLIVIVRSQLLSNFQIGIFITQ